MGAFDILDLIWGGAYLLGLTFTLLCQATLPGSLSLPWFHSPLVPLSLVSQFLLFHAGCHCPSGLKQMPQEPPASLDRQLGSCPCPREESQQLALIRASRALPCSLWSSRAARDAPQACLGQAGVGGVLIESETGRPLGTQALESGRSRFNSCICWVTWDKFLCLSES